VPKTYKMTNAIYGYDITFKAEGLSREEIADWAESHCKSWAFQLEEGQGGYRHYQFRCSLDKKRRLQEMVKFTHQTFPGAHVSITSNIAPGNKYVMKEEGRIEGPWTSDEDTEGNYVPTDMRMEPKWNAMQQTIVDIKATKPDRRTVHCIVDTRGNRGKSFIAMWMDIHKKAIYVPQFADAKDLMRMCFAQPKIGCYFIDLPKATSHMSENALYAGIEQLKTGMLYDDRYKFRKQWIDPCHVFVFTNREPNIAMLSADRWKIKHLSNDPAQETILVDTE